MEQSTLVSPTITTQSNQTVLNYERYIITGKRANVRTPLMLLGMAEIEWLTFGGLKG
jgi:hypothetical protein